MTYYEINSFILNYIENDITGRAIMLTGEWGSGKSYYVKNTLKPFLEDKDNDKHKCVIVSLYGLSDTSEISKALYMELRTIKKAPSSETASTAKVVGKIIGKTVFNGLVSKVGFDIGNIKDEDLQKVYESIDLTDKLIVLEDIERTEIDIIELLGYVNNMCENDGVKVLLVTNESELLTTYEKKDDKGKTTRYYTDDALAYKRAKEKTIGDTIIFECDYNTAILQIVNGFGDELSIFNNNLSVDDIRELFYYMSSYNLRAFIYGCQKTKEILEFINSKKINMSDEIKSIIFYSIIGFTQQQGMGFELNFEKTGDFSSTLGISEKHPLFRFCFDYIIYHTIAKEDIERTINNFRLYRLNSKWNSEKDKDLLTVKYYHTSTEKEVSDSIKRIPDKLSKGVIPIVDYGVLLNYLIAIRYDVGIKFNLEEIEQIIICNLKKTKPDFNSLFNSSCQLYTDTAKNSFDSIKEKMRVAIEEVDVLLFNENIDGYLSECEKNISWIKKNLKNNGFICNIEASTLSETLKKCTSKQLSKFRSLLLELYRGRLQSELLNDDIEALKEIIKLISHIQNYAGYDMIQKHQIKFLQKNIEDIINGFEEDNTGA